MEPYNIQRTRAAGPTKPIFSNPNLGIRCIEPSESHQAAGVEPPMLGVAPDFLDRKEVLSLLTQRMAELPDTSKKVLAMYYHENMPLAEIAACFRLSESRICQIHTQTIALLRNYLDRYLA